MTTAWPDLSVRAGETPQRLGAEIAVVREELGVLLDELDRRRHDLLDVRLQLRRHARGTALTTLALAGVAAGVVWLTVRRRRRGRRLAAEAGRFPGATSGGTEHPGRASVASMIAGKVATAAASAAAVSLVRKAVEHAVRRLLEPQRDGGPAHEPVKVRRLRDVPAGGAPVIRPLRRLRSTAVPMNASEN